MSLNSNVQKSSALQRNKDDSLSINFVQLGDNEQFPELINRDSIQCDFIRSNVCVSNMMPRRELPSIAKLILEVKTSQVNVIREYPMIIVIDIVKSNELIHLREAGFGQNCFLRSISLL